MDKIAKHLSDASVKRLHIALPLILAFFLMFSACLVSAFIQTDYYASSVSTVEPYPVILAAGVSGVSSLSVTKDYANVTATAGFTFYENSSALTGSNTDFSVPASSGSLTLEAGSSVCLYSPAFPSATTIYSGSWTLDIWASAVSSGATLAVTFSAVSSTGVVTAVAASGYTAAIGVTESKVETAFAGLETLVASGGRLLANITNPAGSGNTFTIYWGSGQATNFQTTADYNYVLAVTNFASETYDLSLLTYSSSAISRLTNMTIFVYSPSTQEIIVDDGGLTQSSGPTVTLSPSSTLYLRVFAMANAYGSSNIMLLLKVTSDTRPVFYDAVNLTVS